MTGAYRRAVRRAAVDRVDRFVLDRMRTLVNRAARGVGERRDEVIDVVADGLAGLWDRSTGDVARSPALRSAIVEQFHRLYYHSDQSTWQQTWYRGVTIWKCPLDLWIYQELVHEIGPDLIVETGTAYGGSALFLADLCDIIGHGHVVSIDNRDRAGGADHPRLTKIIGSSTDPDIHGRVAAMVPPGGSALVILDADHARDHVLAEMRLWNDLVAIGSYLVVEDTNLNGHPVYPAFGPGPFEAVEVFLAESDAFEVDESRHKFLLTWNPGGFLKRVR